MKVILAKSAGFCMGVDRAVKKALLIAKKTGKPVHTDGPLIHNRRVIEKLRSDRILASTDASEDILLSPPPDGSRILIRAHGITPRRRMEIEKLNASVIDATCPDVARIQGTIKKYSKKGFYTVIFGDNGHAEVEGLRGYAEIGVTVISSAGEVNLIPDLPKICMVSQSTQFPEHYKKTAERLLETHPEAVILDTICESTKSRQRELLEMADHVDVFVVVGGVNSANSVRLAELAATLKPTFHVQTAEQLRERDFKKIETVGLTSGASTPRFIIDAVRDSLARISS